MSSPADLRTQAHQRLHFLAKHHHSIRYFLTQSTTKNRCVACWHASFVSERELTQLSEKMSWPGLAVSKAVEVGNKNNITYTVRNYADSVVQLAGQAAKRFLDRIGGRSFRSVKKSIQRSDEAAVSCRGPERLEILRRWVLLLKEVERLKLSQGSGDDSYNSGDGQP